MVLTCYKCRMQLPSGYLPHGRLCDTCFACLPPRGESVPYVRRSTRADADTPLRTPGIVYLIHIGDIYYVGSTKRPLHERLSGHAKSAERHVYRRQHALYNTIHKNNITLDMLHSHTTVVFELEPRFSTNDLHAIEALFVQLYKRLYGTSCCNKANPAAFLGIEW